MKKLLKIVGMMLTATMAGAVAGDIRPQGKPGEDSGATTKPARLAEVDGLIRQLGARDLASRETATRRLKEIGEPARAAVEAARTAKPPDPEVVARAEAILREMNIGRRSEPVEKDGLSISVVATQRLFSTRQKPSFIVELKNVSRRPLRLHDRDRLGDVSDWSFALHGEALAVSVHTPQFSPPKVAGLPPGTSQEYPPTCLPPGKSHRVLVTVERFLRPVAAGRDGAAEAPQPPEVVSPPPGIYGLAVKACFRGSTQRPKGEMWVGELASSPAWFAIRDGEAPGPRLPDPPPPLATLLPPMGERTLTGELRLAFHNGKRRKDVLGELWADDGYIYSLFAAKGVEVEDRLGEQNVAVQAKIYAVANSLSGVAAKIAAREQPPAPQRH